MAESSREREWFEEMMWTAATHSEWRHPNGLDEEIDERLGFLSEDTDSHYAQINFRRGGTYVLLNFRDNAEKAVWGMLEVPISGAPDHVLEKGLMPQEIYDIHESVNDGLEPEYLERHSNAVRPFGLSYDEDAEPGDLRAGMSEAAEAADMLADEYRENLKFDPNYS